MVLSAGERSHHSEHRLVGIAPQAATVLLGLNTSCTYFGVTTAGVIGALGINVVGVHHLGYLGAAFVIISLGIAELATWRINLSDRTRHSEHLASA